MWCVCSMYAGWQVAAAAVAAADGCIKKRAPKLRRQREKERESERRVRYLVSSSLSLSLFCLRVHVRRQSPSECRY